MRVFRRALTAVLAIAAIASGVLTVVVVRWEEPAVVKPAVSAEGKYRVGTVGKADEVDAVKAASGAITVALSYDYRSLDQSLKAATKLMTPAFAKEFEKTFEGTTREMAVDKQAITSSLVRAAGIVGTVEDGKATVLVFLDQVLISSKAKKADDPLKVSQNRVHVTLREVDGRWLVSGIDPF